MQVYQADLKASGAQNSSTVLKNLSLQGIGATSKDPSKLKEILQCKDCDYTTVNLGLLKNHSRKHTGDMLQCQHCDYTTTRSDCLKVHSLEHTGDICFSVNIVIIQLLILMA